MLSHNLVGCLNWCSISSLLVQCNCSLLNCKIFIKWLQLQKRLKPWLQSQTLDFWDQTSILSAERRKLQQRQSKIVTSDQTTPISECHHTIPRIDVIFNPETWSKQQLGTLTCKCRRDANHHQWEKRREILFITTITKL